MILPGIIIGDGAIVGAGSVVRGSVPPWTIVVGSPAKPVGDSSGIPLNLRRMGMTELLNAAECALEEMQAPLDETKKISD